GFTPPAEPVAADRVLLIAAALAEQKLRESETIGDVADRDPDTASQLIVLLDGRRYPVSLRPEGVAYRIDRDGESCLAATDWRPGEPLLHLRIGERIATVQIERLPARALRLVHC